MTGGIPARMSRVDRVRGAIALLLLGVALALLVPLAKQFAYYPVTFVAAPALAAYMVRRRAVDAVLFVGAHWLAGWPEELVGAEFMACLTLPVLALTLRPMFSMLMGCMGYGLVLAGIRLKMQFAGSALTSQDLRYFFLQFRDNIGVMASQPTLVAYAAGGGVVLAAAAVAAWKLDTRLWGRTGRNAITWLVIPYSVILVLWASALLAQQGREAMARGAWSWGEYSHFRPLSTFVSTAGISATFNPKRVEGKWLGASGPQGDGQGDSARKDPSDIVLVLQESQFNPATIAGCPAALCQQAAFGSDETTQAYGPLRVHLFGGGTWLSEFALNAGVPHTMFGPAGDFAPFNVAPGMQRTLARSLRAAGYRTVVVYPVAGGMMNARAAYEGYGFDRFYDPFDLGAQGGWGTPDEVIHRTAMRVLQQERRHGQPVFLMVVTIFNHSQHGVSLRDVPPSLLDQARAAFPEPAEANNVADYLWRTTLFEKALAETTATVLKGPRPAIVAWFGDHQPPFGGALGLRDRIGHFGGAKPGFHPRYQTWYHIASNQGTPARSPTAPLDIVFLPGLLAELAGAPMDDWLTANAAARRRCGGLLLECKEPAVRDAYLSFLAYDLQAFGAD